MLRVGQPPNCVDPRAPRIQRVVPEPRHNPDDTTLPANGTLRPGDASEPPCRWGKRQSGSDFLRSRSRPLVGGGTTGRPAFHVSAGRGGFLFSWTTIPPTEQTKPH